MYISYSRMSSYLRCPYLHYLRYVQGLEKKKPERPLYFGSDFHKLLEFRNDPQGLEKAMSEIKDTFYEIPSSWQADLGENYVQDLFCIFEDYQSLYKDTKQPQVTEKEFEIEVGSHKGEPIVFVGKIDELYLRKSEGKKKILIGEHKTFSSKPNMSVLVMNPQKCLYAKAVQFFKGIQPEKVIWDYIKSVPASEPIWLEQSKRFSEASSNKITPMSWYRACEARGITDKGVIKKGDRYAHNIGEFFFKVTLDIDPKMVENVWDGYIYTSKHIIQFGRKNTAKNITRDCSWCTYYDICYAEMTGGEPEYAISKDFTRKEREDNGST